MKVIKITSLLLAGAVLSAFTYANVRHVSPTTKLEKVHLVSFKLTGALTADKKAILKNDIANTTGVTACAINPEGNVAAVIFHPKDINEITLKNKLTASGDVTAEKIEFPTSGGCPIHAMNNSFASVITFLDLRN
jgi:hypothetical protein